MQEETRAFVAKKVGEAARLAEQLEANAWTSTMAKGLKEAELKTLQEDIGMLDDFLKLLNSTWSEAVNRVIGWLEWAPKIQNDVDDRHYTWDGAVFQLNKAKWAKESRETMSISVRYFYYYSLYC